MKLFVKLLFICITIIRIRDSRTGKTKVVRIFLPTVYLLLYFLLTTFFFHLLPIFYQYSFGVE